jgi:hypothetical protein
MNFAKVIRNINEEYDRLLEKVRNGCYERHIP